MITTVKPEETNIVTQPPLLQVPNDDSSKTRQVSPTPPGMKSTTSSSNVLVEQPKISQNALENVKLRSTVRYKPTAPQPTPPTNGGLDEITNNRGIANRLSLFEQQKQEMQLEKEKEKSANQFLNVKLKKTITENANENSNENSEGIFKLILLILQLITNKINFKRKRNDRKR